MVIDVISEVSIYFRFYYFSVTVRNFQAKFFAFGSEKNFAFCNIFLPNNIQLSICKKKRSFLYLENGYSRSNMF